MIAQLSRNTLRSRAVERYGNARMSRKRIPKAPKEKRRAEHQALEAAFAEVSRARQRHQAMSTEALGLPPAGPDQPWRWRKGGCLAASPKAAPVTAA